ncbi:right-handed parallel beta-helix repeat-containing protein [Caldimonas tepidiphila]|uniref:right-handed parallel beta-helix repeat-containing protein n=1 Tax=Caldimonas tepidiphila TaxID=2315841 RepID=UPI00196B08E4|nr:right-handed parallel beta-helix repeat-containing protein [Caldimonas tepidiphila]
MEQLHSGPPASGDAGGEAAFDPELAGLAPSAERPAARERAAAAGGDASRAGEVTLPHPTLEHLSIEWAVAGDADLDGVVAVRFRPAGSGSWRQGMALRRVPAGSNAGFAWEGRHSGSLFGLEPGTRYEIELTLHDPDGGSAVRTVEARTRALPAPMRGAPVRTVSPSNLAAALAAAQPGDILELGAGRYPGFVIARSGSAGRPLVIRSRAGAVIDGDIEMHGREHVHLSGLTVHGRLRLNATRHVAVTHNTVHAREDGIVQTLRSEDSYIADNLVLGGTPWAESSFGVNGDNVGRYGIRVTGPGHVIQRNRVSGFRDDIGFMSGSEAVDQFSIDVLDNDLRNAADDAVEADYCRHNCRIVGNRVTNAFAGMSAQPSLGGPTYFVRNAMYNIVYTPFKLHNGSTGDVILHNTVVKSGDALGIYSGTPIRHAVFRNNLFIGGPGGRHAGYHSGPGEVLSISRLELDSVRMEHNAYGSVSGEFRGQIGWEAFSSVAALHDTLKDRKTVRVGLDGFAAPVAYPEDPVREHAPPDLRLAPRSPARDAAVRIPNVNDGHEGRAPDIGAFEAGAPLPAWGPRGRGR